MNAQTPGGLVTEEFAYDGGRSVTVDVPPESTGSVVFLADAGWHVSALSEALHRAGSRSTLVAGVHGLPDDDGRLHECVLGFETAHFASHETFFVHEVGQWLTTRFGIQLHPERTAVWGASLGGEFALDGAWAPRCLRFRPRVFARLWVPPAGHHADPAARVYFVAGEDEPFFLDNATRWVAALRDNGATVVRKQRPGGHGGSFWAEEFPLDGRLGIRSLNHWRKPCDPIIDPHAQPAAFGGGLGLSSCRRTMKLGAWLDLLSSSSTVAHPRHSLGSGLWRSTASRSVPTTMRRSPGWRGSVAHQRPIRASSSTAQRSRCASKKWRSCRTSSGPCTSTSRRRTGHWNETAWCRSERRSSACCGNLDEAIERYRRAEQFEAAQGAHALLARTRVDLADVLLQREALGDDADAERLLTLAEREAARMGAGLVEQRARRVRERRPAGAETR